MQDFDINVQKRIKVIHHDLKAEINPEISSSIGLEEVAIIILLTFLIFLDWSITLPSKDRPEISIKAFP